MTFPGAWGRFFLPLVLFLLPAAVYWNTINHRYGFRDDYSILRETREEPGKITRVCAAQARPLFGFLLEKSFARLDGVDNLRWMRLLSAGLFGGLAVLLYFGLRREGWDDGLSAVVAVSVALLPGAQVMVSWAVAWPPVLALLPAFGSFACAERAFRVGSARTRAAAWIGGVGMAAASALIYQANALFYLVPLTASLARRLDAPLAETGEWLLRHVATLGLGLGLALVIAINIFAWGDVEASSRVAFADSAGRTLEWFLREPLTNALALFALDGIGATAGIHSAAVVLAVAILAAGVIGIWKKWGWQKGALAIVGMGLLPVVAYMVNLLSTERVATYRTMIPLTSVILVLLAVSLRQVAGPRVTLGIFIALSAVGAWSAHRQPFDWIARPQGIELALVEAGATSVNPTQLPRIFIITPTLAEAPALVRIADEFGSLTTDSDWAPKEMFGLAMRRFFGDVSGSYTLETGRTLPAGQHYDVIIDLGRLREFQPR